MDRTTPIAALGWTVINRQADGGNYVADQILDLPQIAERYTLTVVLS
jgi:hypothetical protein